MCAIFCEKFEDTDFLHSIFHFEIHNIQVGGIFAVGCGSASVMSSFRNVRVFTSDI